MSMIYELKECDSYGPRKLVEYSVPPKRALVCYIMQRLEGNGNTWEYPEIVPGMREGSNGAWYFDDFKGRRVLCAYPF